jgi:hypothetical protein
MISPSPTTGPPETLHALLNWRCLPTSRCAFPSSALRLQRHRDIRCPRSSQIYQSFAEATIVCLSLRRSLPLSLLHLWITSPRLADNHHGCGPRTCAGQEGGGRAGVADQAEMRQRRRQEEEDALRHHQPEQARSGRGA